MKKTLENSPWRFFDLPRDDEVAMRLAYAEMLGDTSRARSYNEMQMLEAILWPVSVQKPGRTNTYDLHSPEAYHFAKVAIIASFLAQYYQPSHSSYTIPELPEKVLHYFRPPYGGPLGTRDYNRDALIAWRKTLPEHYRQGVFIKNA